MNLSSISTSTSTSNNSEHEVELITQSLLEDTEDIYPTPIELDTDPRKRKKTYSIRRYN